MSRLHSSLVRIYTLSVLLVVCVGMLSPMAYAARPTVRSLRLGNVTPGATTTHTFSFTYPTSTSIGSIVFQYCDSPLIQLPCNAPAGLDVSGVTLDQQSGETGYSIDGSSTTSKIVLTRTPAIAANIASSYLFSGAVNPTGAPAAFYVRIFTHASTDASDAPVDFGAVVNTTMGGIYISTEVPPILNFCVGQQIPSDCASADGTLVDLGTLRPTAASIGSSQMIASTNAEFGLAILVQGGTMSSGNITIPALVAPTENAPGNAQFGINLRANTDPAVGEDPTGVGLTVPMADYSMPNRYVYRSGDVVATTPSATDVRKFTVSYIVNVPPMQNPGIYTTTLTYICTATF